MDVAVGDRTGGFVLRVDGDEHVVNLVHRVARNDDALVAQVFPTGLQAERQTGGIAANLAFQTHRNVGIGHHTLGQLRHDGNGIQPEDTQ